uniref:Ethylmalonyl-CoA decarboxylase n=1 Tax=Caenorhabditis tropicalis TaxID=1561998 RepID=A0A1I7TKA1_9PELO
MAGRVVKPTCSLLEVFKSWKGGAIRIQRNDKLKTRLDVILDRPEKNNCLSGEMMKQFGEHAQKFGSDENAVIVISGVGKSFCSGADLGLIQDISERNLGVDMFEYMSEILSSINSSPAITISKIHGHALGGATEICSSADIRMAHFSSKIAFFQSKMGIVPSWGGAEYLEKIMGRGKALAAMGRANVMTAEEAKQQGYVDYVYKTEEEAEEYIIQIASSGLNVTRAQKAMLNAVKVGTEAQKKILESVWNGETHRNALKKQLEAVIKNKLSYLNMLNKIACYF